MNQGSPAPVSATEPESDTELPDETRFTVLPGGNWATDDRPTAPRAGEERNDTPQPPDWFLGPAHLTPAPTG